MEEIISYLSFFAIMLVVILLAWSLLLNYKDRRYRKITVRRRLIQLRQKIDNLPEETDNDRAKKDTLFRELFLEYFENILGEMENLKGAISSKSHPDRKAKKKEKPPRRKTKK